jgi:hypothetical protein
MGIEEHRSMPFSLDPREKAWLAGAAAHAMQTPVKVKSAIVNLMEDDSPYTLSVGIAE